MSKRYLQWGYDSFKDNKTGEICDNYIDLLNQQDKRIAELEEQLSEKEILLQYGKTEIKKLNKRINDIVKRDEKLFKSQPAEIVEKIRNICSIEDKCKDGSFVLGINEKDLDNLLKEYQK